MQSFISLCHESGNLMYRISWYNTNTFFCSSMKSKLHLLDSGRHLQTTTLKKVCRETKWLGRSMKSIYSETMPTEMGQEVNTFWPTCGISRGTGSGHWQKSSPLCWRQGPRSCRPWHTRPLLLHVWLVFTLYKGTAEFLLRVISVTLLLFWSSPPLKSRFG